MIPTRNIGNCFGMLNKTPTREGALMLDRWKVVLLVLALLLGNAGSSAAQAQASTKTLVGTIQLLVHGDQTPDTQANGHQQDAPIDMAVLQTRDGSSIRLKLTARQASQLFTGAEVQVKVPLGTPPETAVSPVSLVVETANRTVAPQALPAGPYPIAQVFCQFEGDPLLLGQTEPPMRLEDFVTAIESLSDVHTIRSLLNQMIGRDLLAGSRSTRQVVNMPEPRANYFLPDPDFGDIPDFNKIMTHCAQAATGLINFSNFSGINFIYSSLGCCFWGGRGLFLPVGPGGTNKEFGYTLADGNYPWWLAFLAHELGHSLPIVADFGWYHSADLLLRIGNPFDLMSEVAAYCPDDTIWQCTPQGTTAMQMLRAGRSLQLRTVGLLESGPVEVTIGYLHEPLAAGYLHAVEVILDKDRRISCEARRGLQANADYKLWDIDGVACYFVNEKFHAPHELQDLAAKWSGDGSSFLDLVGGVNDPPLELEGVSIDVRSKTSNGYRLRLTVPQRAVLAHDIDPGVVSVYARNFPANLQLPATLPVTVTVKPDTAGTAAIVEKIYLALDRETGGGTPTWRGALPCIQGQREYTLEAHLLGLSTDAERTTELNRECPRLRPTQQSGSSELKITPTNFPPGTAFPAEVNAPYDLNGARQPDQIRFVLTNGKFVGTLPCRAIHNSLVYKVYFALGDVALTPNEFTVVCQQRYLPVALRSG